VSGELGERFAVAAAGAAFLPAGLRSRDHVSENYRERVPLTFRAAPAREETLNTCGIAAADTIDETVSGEYGAVDESLISINSDHGTTTRWTSMPARRIRFTQSDVPAFFAPRL
jgi:hypothetical protein